MFLGIFGVQERFIQNGKWYQEVVITHHVLMGDLVADAAVRQV